MSELEQSGTGTSHESPRPDRNEDVVGLLGRRSVSERGGLPRDYQMRADSHYVDQLESRYVGPAVRLIPTREIETVDPSSSVRLEALAQSIAAHGILQPLLVRRHDGRYRLIAGRKRLAAAIAAGITDVPCLIHDVGEAEAVALAQADNLRGPVFPEHVHSCEPADLLHQVLRALSVDLASIGSSAALLKLTSNALLQHRVAADLVQAQAWRAAWLANATAVIAGQHRESRAKPIGAILDRVKAGFEAEARLTRLQLNCSVAPNAACFTFDEDFGVIALTGCVFATLAWLDGLEEPCVEVHAEAPNPRTLKIEVVQRTTPVPAEMARALQELGHVRPGDLPAAIGLLTLKSLAMQHGGTAEFLSIPNRGSLIQSTFCRPNGN